MTITVLKPGLQTQVQDTGRWGWQADGVPVGGAMDGWSHRLANLLVGQDEDMASLEMLMNGPQLRFDVAARIAITGAELSPTIGGQPVPMRCRVDVPAGATLSFGRREAGLHAYLAVAGGIDVPPMLGSRSTYVRGAMGGIDGRALQAGDVLPIGTPASSSTPGGDDAAAALRTPDAGCAFAAWPAPALDLLTMLPLPEPQACATVAVVAGEHWHDFDEEARQSFLSQRWRIGGQSDRMGYRLEGRALGLPSTGEMLSEGVAFGTVQVPPAGLPIVLMAERASLGGYPKIAHVAGVDLPLLAQLAPGQALRFELVELDLAQALLEDRARQEARLCARLLAATA